MISLRLKELRLRQNLSQGEIADKIGVARTTYSGYENTGREPDFETLMKIVDYYNVSLDYLFMRDFRDSEVITKLNDLPEHKKEVIKSLVHLLLE